MSAPKRTLVLFRRSQSKGHARSDEAVLLFQMGDVTKDAR